MDAVSLTKFIDFVSKSARPKMTVVKNWKNRDDYSPKTDYYKRFRDAVIKLHKEDLEKKHLTGLIGTIINKNKLKHYPAMIQGYKKWMGRKQFEWFKPQRVIWKSGKFELNVNPELRLKIDKVPYFIKLYMKADKLTKAKADLITNVMADAYMPAAPKYCNFAVLDVRASRLYSATNTDSDLLLLLQGEAAYWTKVYNAI